MSHLPNLIGSFSLLQGQPKSTSSWPAIYENLLVLLWPKGSVLPLRARGREHWSVMGTRADFLGNRPNQNAKFIASLKPLQAWVLLGPHAATVTVLVVSAVTSDTMTDWAMVNKSRGLPSSLHMCCKAPPFPHAAPGIQPGPPRSLLPPEGGLQLGRSHCPREDAVAVNLKREVRIPPLSFQKVLWPLRKCTPTF